MSKEPHPSRIQVWGLTGGAATGKSTVAQILAKLGGSVIDADQIAHALSAPGGSASAEVLKRFGTLDRTQLRSIVFQDAKAKKDLETILHPAIQTESQRQIEVLKKTLSKKTGSHLIVYEAALLLEAGRLHEFNGIILTLAPKSIRIKRLIQRNGHTPELAEKIIASQATERAQREAVKTLAHFIIVNDGTHKELIEKVESWYRGLFTS